LTEGYSHGMRQRLVFAAAILHDPPVLVVDEPMVGLDPKSVRLVKDLLRARASAGMTIFMSTHTLAVVEEIADRIGIIDHGRMNFLGTIPELRRAMRNHEMSLEHLFLERTGGGNGRPASPDGEDAVLVGPDDAAEPIAEDAAGGPADVSQPPSTDPAR
jgi:ABC-2 type transport system ATP-binding protein